jgi:hypothetical protein
LEVLNYVIIINFSLMKAGSLSDRKKGFLAASS